MPLTRRQERILAEVRVRGRVDATQLAAREGVSAMTVRRDLRGLDDAGLVRRVHGGAVPVDYRPSTGIPSTGRKRAADPATDSTLFTLGLCVPDAEYYFPHVVAGAVDQASALGGRVVLAFSRYETTREQDQIRRLVANGVDGLLVATAEIEAPGTLELLSAVEIPSVLLERSAHAGPPQAGLESVRSDHDLGAAMAVEHLNSLGHRVIAHAVLDTHSSTAVRAGYLRELARGGLTEHSLVEPGPWPPLRERTHDVIDALLACRATAVCVHPDWYALELVEALGERGVSVPDDISVVAHDDVVAAHADVPLTAIAPPKMEVGRFATTMLVERLSTLGGPAFPLRHLTLAPALVVRDSTAPVAGGGE
ncbi:LacI family DNA-binding transcriptional regulator [Pseudactinotalea sp.]|uniref:LacI family DNA-binding transcriptional regulator n=1 Tax=Pseudactinotalea sp. TaxID=1926260 RepID=UPI003B3A19A6